MVSRDPFLFGKADISSKKTIVFDVTKSKSVKTFLK